MHGHYYIGTIATDCGKIKFDDNGKKYYDPPRYISHWTDDITDWDRPVHYDRFYDKYLKNETDHIKKSFYMGYYIHLLTDALWVELVARPVIESFESIDEFKIKAKNQFKAEWYDTELKFLKNNPDYYPLKILRSIKKFDNIYLDYGATEDILDKIYQTLSIYNLSEIDKNNNKKEFTYLTFENYENAVNSIGNIIKMIIFSK